MEAALAGVAQWIERGLQTKIYGGYYKNKVQHRKLLDQKWISISGGK